MSVICFRHFPWLFSERELISWPWKSIDCKIWRFIMTSTMILKMILNVMLATHITDPIHLHKLLIKKCFNIFSTIPWRLLIRIWPWQGNVKVKITFRMKPNILDSGHRNISRQVWSSLTSLISMTITDSIKSIGNCHKLCTKLLINDKLLLKLTTNYCQWNKYIIKVDHCLSPTGSYPCWPSISSQV